MLSSPDSTGVVAGRRFPRRVFGRGTEPDPRFTLANERTFLAWIRTALACIAGGVALETLGLHLHPGLRLAASLVLIAAGMMLPLMAWWAWTRAEAAMRTQAPLPPPSMALPLGVAVCLVGVLLLLGVLLAAP